MEGYLGRCSPPSSAGGVGRNTWRHALMQRDNGLVTDTADWSNLRSYFEGAPFCPPRVRDIARSESRAESDVRDLMNRLERAGHLYNVAHDHYFSAQAVAQLATHVDVLCERDGAARAATMRDAIGGGRKVAIHILEFFDRIGYTERINDEHVRVEPGLTWQWVR